MATFRFNVFDGTSISDALETEQLTLDAARQKCIRLASEMMRSAAVKPSEKGENWCLQMSDDVGSVLYRIKVTATSAVILSQ